MRKEGKAFKVLEGFGNYCALFPIRIWPETSIADERIFYDPAQNLNHQGLNFLNTWGGAGRYDDTYIHKIA